MGDNDVIKRRVPFAKARESDFNDHCLNDVFDTSFDVPEEYVHIPRP